MEHVTLVTSDGLHLEADLAMATSAARGALAICHPHPLYGGNRFSLVVDAIFRSAPGHGYHALRFDFRADHDHGRAERLDLIAAVDALSDLAPGPIHVVGYSFGAMVALRTADERIASIVAIAPPLGHDPEPLSDPGRPVLILSPEHDQFCPPERAAQHTGQWARCEVRTVPMTDHSLAGQTAGLMAIIHDWLS